LLEKEVRTMFNISTNQARGYAIAAVCVLALGLFMSESAGSREPFVYPEDEYAPMMFKRLKEVGGGPRGFNNGLAEVKWGAPLAGFHHMALVEKLGATQVTHTNALYRNGDEHLTLNGVTVSPVRYWFVDEQLGSVSLGYQGREQWYKLKQWVEKVYGPLERDGSPETHWDAQLRQYVNEPRTVSEMPTDPGWSGELSWLDAGTQVSLSWYPKTEAGELVIISPVLDELHAYEGVGPGDC
jgi:hypothetical protein